MPDGATKAVRLCCLLVLLAARPAAGADPHILLGPPDFLVADQPRVAVTVRDPGPPIQTFGPAPANVFLLDTAAQGILAVDTAVAQMVPNGYQTVAQYEETGIGTMMMDVSAAYEVEVTGDSGGPQTLTGVRLLSSATLNLMGYDGVVGMAGLVGRIASLDLAAMMAGGFPDYMDVHFPAAMPPGGGHRYDVPLTLVDFPPAGQQDPGDPLPTMAPLPFAAASLTCDGATAPASLAMDTGAQLSIISTSVAFALGMDSDGDGDLDADKILGYLPIGGVGSADAPLVSVDRLALPTAQGVDLVWTDVLALVVDIDPAIDGVVGMEVLAGGWADRLLGGPVDGYFEQIHFDFRDAANLTGMMSVDLAAVHDVVVPEPASAALLAAAAGLVAIRRRRE